jgi:hypothetical protein
MQCCVVLMFGVIIQPILQPGFPFMAASEPLKSFHLFLKSCDRRGFCDCSHLLLSS